MRLRGCSHIVRVLRRTLFRCAASGSVCRSSLCLGHSCGCPRSPRSARNERRAARCGVRQKVSLWMQRYLSIWEHPLSVVLTLPLACSDRQPTQEVEPDRSLVDAVDAQPSDAEAPDCGCVGSRYQTLVIRDRSETPAGRVFAAPGADICGIEVRCGGRVVVGTIAELDRGELYCDECSGPEYFDPEQALDTGEGCINPPPEGEPPAYVSLGFGGKLTVQFADAGPCGLAGCQIVVREADPPGAMRRENRDEWNITVCADDGSCVRTLAGRSYIDGDATINCCTCEPW